MSASEASSEGLIPFIAPPLDTPCETWYKIIGDINAPDAIPLIVLHGGPGGTHHCVLSNTALARPTRPIIFYDQIGCGASTHLRASVPASFWSAEVFLAELSNLLTHLGLQGRAYDMLGHSWGGMLAALHASTQPSGLRKLVLANPPPDFKSWGRVAAECILPLLSSGAREAVAEGERTADEGGRDSVAYQAAMEELSLECGCRKEMTEDPGDEYSRDMGAAMKAIMEDDTVPIATCGPSEFDVTGTLTDLDVTTNIDKVQASTLLLSGTYDRYRPVDDMVRPFLDKNEHVKWVNFEHSSHMPSYEEPERYLKVVDEFLTPVLGA